MPTVRTEISVWCSDSKPADYTTHVVHHTVNDTSTLITGGPDWSALAQQIGQCFVGLAPNYATANLYNGRNVTAKCYDIADAKPRPVKGQWDYRPAGVVSESTLAPGQIALVMSYYGARNLPRERGRLFFGPLSASNVNSPRPSSTIMGVLQATGHALFDVGGEDVAWVVYSRTGAKSEPVTTIWTDDSYDVQRRRKRAATTRQVLRP